MTPADTTAAGALLALLSELSAGQLESLWPVWMGDDSGDYQQRQLQRAAEMLPDGWVRRLAAWQDRTPDPAPDEAKGEHERGEKTEGERPVPVGQDRPRPSGSQSQVHVEHHDGACEDEREPRPQLEAR